MASTPADRPTIPGIRVYEAPVYGPDPLEIYLPADWNRALPCDCGHGRYQHQSGTGLCYYEAQVPPADRCREYRPYHQESLW